MGKTMMFGYIKPFIKDSWHGNQTEDRIRDSLYYFKAFKNAELEDKEIIELESLSYDCHNHKDYIGWIFHWVSPTKESIKESHYNDSEKYAMLYRNVQKMGTLKYYYELIAISQPKFDEPNKPIICNYHGKSLTTCPILKFRRLSYDYHTERQDVISENDKIDILQKKFNGKMKIGAYFISKEYARFGVIRKLEITQRPSHERQNHRNPHERDTTKDIIMLVYDIEDKDNREVDKVDFSEKDRKIYIHAESDTFEKEFLFVNDSDINSFLHKIRITQETASFDHFDRKLIGEAKMEEEFKESQNGLIVADSTEYLQSIRTMMTTKSNNVQAIETALKRNSLIYRRNTEIQINKFRKEMEAKLESEMHNLQLAVGEMNRMMTVFQKKIEKIEKFIATIEIFLGIKEEIVQIATGKIADESEIISLRQQLLYMDIEFGDPLYSNENGKGSKYDMSGDGMDADDFQKFEKWLIESGHYKNVLPEQKCVVVMKPRSTDKFYVDNPFINKAINYDVGNFKHYILIRNGENIYRIMSKNIFSGNRLFPLKTEVQGIYNEFTNYQIEKEKLEKQAELENTYKYDNEINKLDEKIVSAEDIVSAYKKNMLLIQGLIMRTEIFNPVPIGLDIFKPETYIDENGTDRLKFIYDDEDNMLPSGRLPYKEWLNQQNINIVKGTRIFFSQPNGGSNDWDDRFSIKWNKEGSNNPPMPPSGLYELYERKEIVKSYATQTITSKEWQLDEYNHSQSIINNNRDFRRKYERARDVRGIDDAKGVYVYILDNKGNKTYKEEEKTTLRISYNPKDTVWRGWGSSHGERKTNLTFIVYPDDEFIINYDNMLLGDILFYLNDRLNRIH